jgi:hypothetical protein
MGAIIKFTERDESESVRVCKAIAKESVMYLPLCTEARSRLMNRTNVVSFLRVLPSRINALGYLQV